MKNQTRRTQIRREISIETHELTIIRANGSQSAVWCERCHKTVTAFAPEQITAVLKFSAFHRIAENDSLICGESLRQNAETRTK